MVQDTIDKIINIQFKYSDLIKGWTATSAAIGEAKINLQAFKKAGNTEGVVKQTSLIKALKSELQQYAKELQDNIKIEMQASGSVNQLNARISKLTAQYKAMSGEVRKSSLGESVAKEIREMQEEVNAANEALLNFRDSVGNYASAAKGFTPLSFQVQQLAREMPSLTMSLQQFFLAISNNVPMFVDELKRAKVANEALRAEGKATIPVFRQVLMSIVSWQTALVVGITLLTAYGKEIGEWVKGLFAAKEVAISMAEAQRRVNDALAEDGYGIGEQIAKVKELQIQWKALGDNLNARKQFVVDNKDAFDDLGVKIDDVNDAENLLVTSTDNFIQALSLRARASAGMKLAAEAYEKALIEQQKVDEEIQKGYVKVFVNEELTTVKRPYTEAEKEEMMAPVRALEAQAKAYIEVSAASEESARKRLQDAGIEEAANEKAQKGANKIAQQAAKTQLQIERELTEAILDLRQEGLAKDLEASEQRFAQERQKLENQLRFDDKLTVKAKEDLNHRLVLLKKQQLNEESKIRRRWSEKEFEEELRNEENRIRMQFKVRSQMDALAAAQVKNKHYSGLISNDESERLRAQQAIAEEELRQAINNRDILAQMDEEQWSVKYESLQAYETARLESENNVQSAMKKTTDLTREQANLQTRTSLTVMSTISGAATSLLNTLAEDNSAFAGFAKALALFNIGVNTAEAISKAIAGNAARPLRMAAAVAAVLTAMQQAYSILSEQSQPSTPSFAAGGLVTGPGTGTSDSITARLSNGEAVMTARAVNDWGAMLSAMNVASGGNAISVSNLPQRNDAMKGMERMLERALRNMPAPIVSVIDINKGQKRVKVQNNLGRLSRKKYA